MIDILRTMSREGGFTYLVPYGVHRRLLLLSLSALNLQTEPKNNLTVCNNPIIH